nr:helix-turn-helix domain-containing protein [uncultured Anaerocolumna sp.]
MVKNEKNTNKALLTANDMCNYLSIGISTAYKLLNTKGFPTVKINSRKYANKELLDKWLEEQTK